MRTTVLFLAAFLARPAELPAQAPGWPAPVAMIRTAPAARAHATSLRTVWSDPEGRVAIRFGATLGATTGVLLVARYGNPVSRQGGPDLGKLALGAIGGAFVGGVTAGLLYDWATAPRALERAGRGSQLTVR